MLSRKQHSRERCTPQGVPYSKLDYYVNEDGQYLFTKSWKPKGKPKAMVFISHGIAEHCLCYDETVARPLTESGCLVVSHDHVGHGQSEGERGQVDSFHVYVRDIIGHIEFSLQDWPALPVFVLGHSMGGIICLVAVLERPELISGIILNAVAISVHPETASPVKITFAKLLAHLCPRLPFLYLKLDKYSSDPKVVAKLKSDPYRYHGGIKAKMAVEVLTTVLAMERRLADIRTPILIAHGTHDSLANFTGSEKLYEKVQSTDKELILFEGCYHQIHWEPNGHKERFARKCIDWIAQRV